MAVPGYVMAYALRGLGGPMGAAQAMFGVTLPRLDGFTGAVVALTLYNTPYMFLTLKVAFERLDPALEITDRFLEAVIVGHHGDGQTTAQESGRHGGIFGRKPSTTRPDTA